MSNLFTLSVLDGYSRNVSYALNLITTFLFQQQCRYKHTINTSAQIPIHSRRHTTTPNKNIITKT